MAASGVPDMASGSDDDVMEGMDDDLGASEAAAASEETEDAEVLEVEEDEADDSIQGGRARGKKKESAKVAAKRARKIADSFILATTWRVQKRARDDAAAGGADEEDADEE